MILWSSEFCWHDSDCWQFIIGAGNGLAPNRCQAISWTNDNPISLPHICVIWLWGSILPCSLPLSNWQSPHSAGHSHWPSLSLSPNLLACPAARIRPPYKKHSIDSTTCIRLAASRRTNGRVDGHHFIPCLISVWSRVSQLWRTHIHHTKDLQNHNHLDHPYYYISSK